MKQLHLLQQTSANTGTRPGAGPWRNCYQSVRNQSQVGPKVIATTEIGNTLRVPLATIIPKVRGSYCGKANPDLSLHHCHDDLRVVINLHVSNINYFIAGRSAK